MKAAVLYEKDGVPVYAEVPSPVPENEQEILVNVRAAALKHFDKGRATGAHYSSQAPPGNGRVIGGDGVCVLPDGTRVYAMGVSGMMAEQATIYKSRVVTLPPGVSDTDAAVLGNAIIGSAMGLKFKAQIKKGDVVLINGATGFTGRVAVQIARYYGASRIVVTGRKESSLQELQELGADETISLVQSDEAISEKLRTIAVSNPVDVVLDYLWGHSAELILASLRGRGHFTKEVRYVSVGSMSGDLISLSAANLRSVNLQLSGSGLGSWSEAAVEELFGLMLPEMFALAADGKLKVKTKNIGLQDIGDVWNLTVPDGQRLVVTIPACA